MLRRACAELTLWAHNFVERALNFCDCGAAFVQGSSVASAAILGRQVWNRRVSWRFSESSFKYIGIRQWIRKSSSLYTRRDSWPSLTRSAPWRTAPSAELLSHGTVHCVPVQVTLNKWRYLRQNHVRLPSSFVMLITIRQRAPRDIDRTGEQIKWDALIWRKKFSGDMIYDRLHSRRMHNVSHLDI